MATRAKPADASGSPSEERRLRRPPGDADYWRWLALIAVVGTGLRLYDLDGIGIWGDEVFEARETISLYRLDLVASLEGLVGHLAVLIALVATGAELRDLEPSDFGSFREAGITPWSLRLAPALIGSLTVPVVGALSRRFIGRRPSLVLALLLALAPWHLYWSQGSRFYAIQFLFYAIAFFLYFEATERGSWRKLIVAMGFFVLAFNAQYTSFVFVPLIAIDWLIGRLGNRSPQLDRTALTVIGVALAAAAAMPAFLFFSLDSYASGHFGSTGSPPWQIGLGIILFINPLVFLVAMASAFIGDALPLRHRSYLVLGAVLPIVIMSALSFRSFSGSRYGFVALLPALALAAVGLVRAYDWLVPRANRLVALVPAAVVVGAFVITDVDFFAVNRGFRPQWESAAELVRAQHDPGEKVAVELIQVGHYLLDDLGDDVVVGTENVGPADGGVWFISTRSHAELLLDRSIIEPDQFVHSYDTRFFVPRHHIEIWYRPSPSRPRPVPPAAELDAGP